VAVAVALRAKTVVIENVRTVTVSHGDVVGMARELLESEGYTVTEDIVRADRLGWPQARERFFLTAIRADLARAPLPEIKERAPRSVMWAIGDLMELVGGVEPFDTAPVPSEENRKRIHWLFDNGLHDLPNSERPDCHKDGTTYTAVYGRMHPDRPGPTITTGIGTPGQGRFIHPMKRRLVTPHEAARIQGFPDGYGFLEHGVPAKRKDLAKWIGDAVPAPMGYEMARRAFAALGL
jgi:DNA (cytosine-5)-methyltransferase 1